MPNEPAELIYIDVEDGKNRVNGNAKLYAKLLVSFKNSKYMAALVEAIEKKDYKTAREAAHAMKGLAANLSLKELHRHASDLDAALKNSVEINDTDDIKACYEKTLENVDAALGKM